MARSVLELGFMISFAGNVTFKKAENLREVARNVPTDRLLIETDCPYLAPVPFRGRRNEPARVVEVARCLAELHEMETIEMGRLTANNFLRFFNLEDNEDGLKPCDARAPAV
jgi:TatD DNase family protein